MAIIKNGINGPFSGKVGTVIGYELGGQAIIRTVGRRRKPFTKQELLNQQKMKLVSQFLSPIVPVIKLGYRIVAPKGSRIGAFQMAQSYVWKNAIEMDEGGNPVINPAKVLISQGNLPPPTDFHIERREGARAYLSWKNPSEGSRKDKGVLLLYSEDEEAELIELDVDKDTESYEGEFNFLMRRTGDIHVYLYFGNLFYTEISNSVYCMLKSL